LEPLLEGKKTAASIFALDPRDQKLFGFQTEIIGPFGSPTLRSSQGGFYFYLTTVEAKFPGALDMMNS